MLRLQFKFSLLICEKIIEQIFVFLLGGTNPLAFGVLAGVATQGGMWG